MRTGAPAFRAGDQLRLRSVEELKLIWTKVTSEALLSLHQVLDPDKEKYAGMGVRVIAVESYFGDVPVYRLEGLKFVWPEESLLDPMLDQSAKIGDPCGPASRVYRAYAKDKTVEIVDSSNFVYCALAKLEPEWEAIWINEIARIRHARAFECQYGFAGQDLINPGPFDAEPEFV